MVGLLGAPVDHGCEGVPGNAGRSDGWPAMNCGGSIAMKPETSDPADVGY